MKHYDEGSFIKKRKKNGYALYIFSGKERHTKDKFVDTALCSFSKANNDNIDKETLSLSHLILEQSICLIYHTLMTDV